MIFDKLAEFCDATALNTGVAGSYFIGSAVDAGPVRDLGAGKPLYLVITVDTAATSGGAATGEFQLRSDDTSTINPTTGSLHVSTGAIALANLSIGKRFMLALPVEGIAYERYLGIVQVTGVAAFTAGKINAFLIQDPVGAAWKAYADAVQ